MRDRARLDSQCDPPDANGPAFESFTTIFGCVGAQRNRFAGAPRLSIGSLVHAAGWRSTYASFRGGGVTTSGSTPRAHSAAGLVQTSSPVGAANNATILDAAANSHALFCRT